MISVLLFEELYSLFDVRATCVLGEGAGEILYSHFRLEDVHLVKEDDDCLVFEVVSVDGFAEEIHALKHSVGDIVLVAFLIVLTGATDIEESADTFASLTISSSPTSVLQRRGD